jgi:conjugal transfer mating pair stabilization protein TraN
MQADRALHFALAALGLIAATGARPRSTSRRPTISSSRSRLPPAIDPGVPAPAPATTFRARHHDRGRGQGRGAQPPDRACAGPTRGSPMTPGAAGTDPRLSGELSRAHPVLRQSRQHVRRRGGGRLQQRCLPHRQFDHAADRRCHPRRPFEREHRNRRSQCLPPGRERGWLDRQLRAAAAEPGTTNTAEWTCNVGSSVVEQPKTCTRSLTVAAWNETLYQYLCVTSPGLSGLRGARGQCPVPSRPAHSPFPNTT